MGSRDDVCSSSVDVVAAISVVNSDGTVVNGVCDDPITCSDIVVVKCNAVDEFSIESVEVD